MLQRWTSPFQGHSISDEIVSRGRVWGWFSAVCFQLLTFLIAFDASSWSFSDKTSRVGEGVHGGCATGQNGSVFEPIFASRGPTQSETLPAHVREVQRP